MASLQVKKNPQIMEVEKEWRVTMNIKNDCKPLMEALEPDIISTTRSSGLDTDISIWNGSKFLPCCFDRGMYGQI